MREGKSMVAYRIAREDLKRLWTPTHSINDLGVYVCSLDMGF